MTSTPTDLRDARFRRNVVRLHQLGPRVTHALLAELAARRLLRTEIEHLVSRYVGLDPVALEAACRSEWPQ